VPKVGGTALDKLEPLCRREELVMRYFVKRTLPGRTNTPTV
jgi:hypothetical protein